MKGVSYAPNVKGARGKGPRTKKAARRIRQREEARRTGTAKQKGAFYDRD